MTINGIENNIIANNENNYSNSDLVFKTIGKRKCATALLSAYRGQGQIIVNGKLLDDYFQYNSSLVNKVTYPFNFLDSENEHDIILRVNGGGLKGQAEAIQLAISKAFASLNKENRTILKQQSLLTRDSRIKERKKYGLKKARKASQFSKR